MCGEQTWPVRAAYAGGVVFQKILRAGEGKILRRLVQDRRCGRVARPTRSAALTDAELRAKTDEFKERYADGESLDSLLPEAFAVVREAATRTLGQRHYRVQIMGGAALHLGNVAEMKTGEGKTLTGVLPAYLNALTGDGVHVVTTNDYLAARDAEWMGRVHRFLGLTVGTIVSGQQPDRAPRAVPVRHHARHEQRVRLRLPARQHGVEPGRPGAARPPLRDRRRGRLDPHRRGPHPADHQRPGRAERQVVRRVRPHRAAAEEGRPLRGGGVQAHGRHHRGGRRVRRGPARHRQPLRGGQHPADRLPEQRAEGQGALPPRPGVHRQQRRGAHRRRVHRPRAGRAPLQRGHAPGHRGQGAGGDQGREPDARHDHAAELLPALREALRDDRYGLHRGRRAAPDLQARRRPDPDEQADGPRGPLRRHLQDGEGQVRRRRRRHRRAARGRPAGAGRHGERREVRAAGEVPAAARHPARGAQREEPRP